MLRQVHSVGFRGFNTESNLERMMFVQNERFYARFLCAEHKQIVSD
jgi:hypothetical protein